MKRTALLLTLAIAACSKSGEPAAPAPAQKAAAPAPAVPGFRDARALLSDEKVIAGYAVYQTEMAPHAKEAMEIFSAAYKQAGGDAKKLEEAARNDPRVVAYNKLNEAALAKAGISESEMRTLTTSLSSYLAELYVARDAQSQAAAAEKKKAAGQKLTIGEEIGLQMGAETASKAKLAQEAFVKQYGQAALDAVTRNEAALLAAQDAMMKSALAK
jgi:hypothetical protein